MQHRVRHPTQQPWRPFSARTFSPIQHLTHWLEKKWARRYHSTLPLMTSTYFPNAAFLTQHLSTLAALFFLENMLVTYIVSIPHQLCVHCVSLSFESSRSIMGGGGCSYRVRMTIVYFRDVVG